MYCNCQCLSKLLTSVNDVVFSFNCVVVNFTIDNVLEPICGKRHLLLPQNLLVSVL